MNYVGAYNRTVYHGVRKPGYAEDILKNGFTHWGDGSAGKGIYFALSYEDAKVWGRYVIECQVTLKDLAETSISSGEWDNLFNKPLYGTGLSWDASMEAQRQLVLAEGLDSLLIDGDMLVVYDHLENIRPIRLVNKGEEMSNLPNKMEEFKSLYKTLRKAGLSKVEMDVEFEKVFGKPDLVSTWASVNYSDEWLPEILEESAPVEKLSNLQRAIRLLGADPSLQPPKRWFNKMKKDVKKSNPDYSAEQVDKTVGSIWSNLSDAKKSEIRGREGKTYGPAED